MDIVEEEAVPIVVKSCINCQLTASKHGKSWGAYLIALDFGDLLLNLLVCSDARLVRRLSTLGITGGTDGKGEARGHGRP